MRLRNICKAIIHVRKLNRGSFFLTDIKKVSKFLSANSQNDKVIFFIMEREKTSVQHFM